MQENKLLKKVKTALRIKTQNEDITNELADLIEACKLDLKLAGVEEINENDALITRAVVLYCKESFSTTEKSEKYKKSYDLLKMSLALAGGYNTKVTPVYKIGQKVIVNGTVYKTLGDAKHWVKKSNAEMFIKSFKNYQSTAYAEVAENTTEPPVGFVMMQDLKSV